MTRAWYMDVTRFSVILYNGLVPCVVESESRWLRWHVKGTHSPRVRSRAINHTGLTHWSLDLNNVTNLENLPSEVSGALQKKMLIQIYRKFHLQKQNFQIKSYDIFHITAQNLDCGYSLEPPRRGGSNEYPQSMFLSRNKKNNVFPCKPQFYYIKVGFHGVNII